MGNKEPKRINVTSPDLLAERLEKVRRLLPDLFDGEGDLNERALRAMLERDSVGGVGKFRFEWAGKQESEDLAFSPSLATLVADRDRSVNFDDTRNLIIEGDNLEVLKLLQTTYFEQIKCIYIDPPYNTGSDFIYSDKYSEDKRSYWESNGTTKKSVKLTSLAESNGRKHSKWLNMMQSRLYAARNLLRRDGAIIIHIDEHEGHRLRLLLEEAFGDENFLGEIIWDKRNPKGDARGVAYQHESILIFAKNVAEFEENNELKIPKKNAEIMLRKAVRLYSMVGKKVVPPQKADAMKVLGIRDKSKYEKKYSLEDINEEFQEWIKQRGTKLSRGEAAYKHIDECGNVYRPVSMAWPNNKEAPDNYFIPLKHPVTGRPCPVPEKGWRYPSETMQKLLEEELILFGPDETSQPTRKYLLGDNMSENLPSLMYHGASDDARLRKMGIFFENPKPVDVAKRLLTGFLSEDDIVMDFFAGSGTTGHAVTELNAESDRNLRFILVQVPAQIKERHSAREAGYETISALCIDRVRKAGEGIKDSDAALSVDTGFRVYHLAESHFPENLFRYEPSQSREENLAALKAHIEAASQVNLFGEGEDLMDLIVEISLKNGYGLFFTLEPLENEFSENQVFRLSGNGKSVLICLDSELKKSTVKNLAKKYAEEQLIVPKQSLGSEEMWTLRKSFGDNMRVV